MLPTVTAAALVAAVHDPWSYAAFVTLLLAMRLRPRPPKR